MPPHEFGRGVVTTRPRTYLIAKNDAVAPAAAGPLEFDWIVEQLNADPDVDVERVLEPRTFALQNAGPAIVQSVIVATMTEDKAAQLAQHPQVVLEEDHPLFPEPTAPEAAPAGVDAELLSPFGTSTDWQIRLQGPGGEPVAGATVFLYGRGTPVQGRTDDTGLVTLSLFNETSDTIRALYVNPQRDYWTLWIDRPALTSGVVNPVALRSLAQTLTGFPRTQHLGWGQEAMRLHLIPRGMTGLNVRVAVVDSGAASLTHSDLRSIRKGVDLTGAGPATTGWTDDIIAHGSHCSGVVAGENGASGIRGFAPAAELHAARIFPGGKLSSLIDAVDYCIEQQIDVVNMSLGTGGTSQIMLQKLAQARQQGVACIVAAGNSGNAVQFPGLSPDVLTVAAVGRDDTFPEDSYHAQTRWPGGLADQGFFAAKFSCHGPEIDVCGPGVAIVSSVPPNGFAAWDGTSMATPHIAGLAALVLAHHPDFQTAALRMRTVARVDRLFEILKGSAHPLELGDPTRTGAGLPDAVRALGLDQPGPSTAQPRVTDLTAQLAAIDAGLEQVRVQLVAAGLLTAVDPASAGPEGPGSEVPTEFGVDQSRQLAALEAQMIAAGLLPGRNTPAMAG
jgi:subtilisin